MKKREEQSLYKKLEQYNRGDFYPFHMPGHKRQVLFDRAYSIDITEIDGFDDLHHPEGILKEKMDRLAAFYEADKSFYLINGSTGGILSAISAVTELGDEILVARNCHKSVFHAIFLRKLKPYYVYPQILEDKWINGGISANDVENELNLHPNIKAVVIVSPTYEGIVSDIESIVKVSHKRKIPVIVDEAHGAHFRYAEWFPKSALEYGADLVIQSLHKTLPAMTQTGVLHKKGSLVSEENLKFYLQVYQTSSPSYVLMASIDACFNWMIKNGIESMKSYNEKLNYVYREMENLNYIWHLSKEWIGKYNIVDFDCSKLVFGSKLRSWSGEKIADILRDNYHLEMEMCTPTYVVAMTSVMDTEEGLKRFLYALKELDQIMSQEAEKNLENSNKNFISYVRQETIGNIEAIPLPSSIKLRESEVLDWDLRHQIVLSPYEAFLREKELVSIEHGVGRICAELNYIYPPGIPFFVPGELLEKEDIEKIQYYQKHGFQIRGGSHKKENDIYVIK